MTPTGSATRSERPSSVDLAPASAPGSSRGADPGGKPERDRRRLMVAVADLARPPGGDDPAADDDRDPVGEPLRLVHVVGGEEDGLAEVAEARDHLPRLAARRGVEAGGRLVEEEQVRVADQGDGDIEAPQLAAREAARPRVRLLAQADVLDRPLDPERLTVVAGVQLERLAHGELRPHPALLQDDADPLAPRTRRRPGVAAEHRDLAGAALAVALEHLDRGRLARAVRPQEREHLSLADLEVDSAHRLYVSVGLSHPGDVDHGGRHQAGILGSGGRRS